MKLQVVFSLNVTGSFVEDIFCVVRSIRFCLCGLSLGKDVLEIISHLINVNDKTLSHFLAEKNWIFFLELPNNRRVQYFTDCFSVCGVLSDGFLQGFYGCTCICGSYFFYLR